MPRHIKGFPDYLSRVPGGEKLTELEQVLYNALHHAWRYHDQLRRHDTKMMQEALQLAMAEILREDENEIAS